MLKKIFTQKPKKKLEKKSLNILSPYQSDTPCQSDAPCRFDDRVIKI